MRFQVTNGGLCCSRLYCAFSSVFFFGFQSSIHAYMNIECEIVVCKLFCSVKRWLTSAAFFFLIFKF